MGSESGGCGYLTPADVINYLRNLIIQRPGMEISAVILNPQHDNKLTAVGGDLDALAWWMSYREQMLTQGTSNQVKNEQGLKGLQTGRGVYVGNVVAGLDYQQLNVLVENIRKENPGFDDMELGEQLNLLGKVVEGAGGKLDKMVLAGVDSCWVKEKQEVMARVNDKIREQAPVRGLVNVHFPGSNAERFERFDHILDGIIILPNGERVEGKVFAMTPLGDDVVYGLLGIDSGGQKVIAQLVDCNGERQWTPSNSSRLGLLQACAHSSDSYTLPGTDIVYNRHTMEQLLPTAAAYANNCVYGKVVPENDQNHPVTMLVCTDVLPNSRNVTKIVFPRIGGKPVSMVNAEKGIVFQVVNGGKLEKVPFINCAKEMGNLSVDGNHIIASLQEGTWLQMCQADTEGLPVDPRKPDCTDRVGVQEILCHLGNRAYELLGNHFPDNTDLLIPLAFGVYLIIRKAPRFIKNVKKAIK